MSITVREALKIGGLKHSRLVAGEAGLNRIVGYVDILEVPDPSLWLRGTELLVTTCYAVREDSEGQLNILRAMAKFGAAALAVKFGRFIGQPPPDMLKLADQYAIPLIDVPDGISFLDITHPLMSTIINKHAQQLEYSEKIHRQLTRLALDREGVAAIAGELTQLIGMTVAIYNDDLQCLASSGPLSQGLGASDGLDVSFKRALMRKLPDETLGRPPRMNTITTNISGHSCKIFPVEVQNRRYGYILVIGDNTGDLTEIQNIAIEHAVTVAALQMIRDEAVHEARRSYKRDFLEDLIAGSLKNREMAISRGEMVDLRLDQPYIILVADIDRLPGSLKQGKENSEPAIIRFRDQFRRMTETCFTAWPSRVMVVPRGDSIVVILPVMRKLPNKELRKRLFGLAQELQEQSRQRWEELSITIGIGRMASDPLHFSERYNEVKNVVRVVRKVRGPSQIAFWDDVEIYSLLSELGKPLEQFYQSVLGMIDKPEVKNRQELLQTLREYLECQGNTGEAADRLFIHRNTLRYRLNHIKRLLGRSWDDPDYRFTLLTALKVRDLIVNTAENQ